MPADELKAFKDEAEKMGIKKESVVKMLDQDIDSLAVIALLREGDIAAISLSTGQMLLLSRWVDTLHGTEPAFRSLCLVRKRHVCKTKPLAVLLVRLSSDVCVIHVVRKPINGRYDDRNP